ncbi:MAG: hypothetical protein AAB588_03200 [Patescibacteria group bacterium]
MAGEVSTTQDALPVEPAAVQAPPTIAEQGRPVEQTQTQLQQDVAQATLEQPQETGAATPEPSLRLTAESYDTAVERQAVEIANSAQTFVQSHGLARLQRVPQTLAA